jgi:NADPH:quinone reductase-like Zn-dependent oxidoreductase
MTPKSGREVLVSGASGGLGSYAIAFLHQRGYKVAALSHRKSNRDYLSNLGADSVIDLSEFLATFRRPLESERWAGAIDSVVTSCQRCLAAWLIVAGLPVADWLEPASFLRRYFRLFCEEFD